MKRIPLHHSDLYALVDDDDYARVSMYRWYEQVNRNGAVYAAAWVDQRIVQLHVFLIGSVEGLTVDHKNRVGLDCRRDNLRHATRSQQQANVGIRANNTLGYKGIARSTNGKRWRAFIKVDGHKRHLGTFGSAEDAARAYDDAALDEFGAFALLNFPQLVT